MIKKEIRIPIYHGYLIIILTEDFKDVNEEYNTTFDKTFQAGVFDVITEDGHIKYVVAFDKTTTGMTIAHECVHLVNKMFIDRNIKLDLLNDEPQAYLMGWLFKQCEDFLKKHNMEKEIWKYKVWIGPDCVLETIDKEEAIKTFNDLPSGAGQPASKRRGLTQEKTLLEDGE